MMSDYVCPECGLTHGDSECRASAAAPPREPSPAAIDAACRVIEACGPDGFPGPLRVTEALRAAYAVDGVGGVPPAPPDVSELQGILAQAIRQSERADKPGQGRVECIDFLMFATLVHAAVWRGPTDAPPA